MTKKILVFALFTMIVQIAVGQRFEGGLLAGFNATQVKNDELQGYHKPGILAGIFVQTDIAPAVFGGMEIKFSQKGSRKKIRENDPEPEKYVMRLNYIDIPIFVGFRTNERSAVIGGISAGYLFKAEEEGSYDLFPEEDQNEFNNFDLQPFIGFQFEFLENIKLDLRLAYSVLPIREVQAIDGTTSYWLNNQFNNVISLAFYYRFDR